MGASGSHLNFLPSLPSKQRRAAISQALSRKLEKRKKISRTLKRIIHHNAARHADKDQCKAFRAFLSNWTTVELTKLVEIYESTIALHQVAIEAASAKCSADSAMCDMYLFRQKDMCTDVVLHYKGDSFYAHKSILTSRSSLFNKLLSTQEGTCQELDVPPLLNVDSSTFNAMLCFIYSDTLPELQQNLESDLESLKQQFGVNKSLNQTLGSLYGSTDFYDLNLTFLKTPSKSSAESVRVAQFPCHMAILAARSDLLCHLISKAKNNQCSNSDSSLSVVEIVLDDGVVNHKYAALILKVIYQDILDMNLTTSQVNTVASSSLCEAQAIIAGKNNVTVLEEAFELHHIGNLLELPILTEKCEEYMVDSLCAENLPTVLDWSQQPSGSRWVYRETLQYIQDNFAQISQCPALFTLDQSTLAKVLQSDFLQASETEVLQAVINWSEHQLIRRLEHREPNLVTHTTHSLARKGVRSKDLSDSELRDISAQLMIHVRQSHLFPPNSEVVNSALKRGLIGSSNMSSSQSRDLTASEPYLHHHTTYSQQDSWLPATKSHCYSVPRAYVPFYEVARGMLEERTKDTSESEVIHLRRPCRPFGQKMNSLSVNMQIRHNTVQNMTRSQEEEIQMPFTPEMISEVIHRTEQLLQTRIVVEALQSCWDKTAVLKQVCLWAARELGCPEHIIFTVKAKTGSVTPESHHSDLIASSLVPDLAPERLLLHHGVSASFENLTVHSVNSSPDVTLLSVRSYKQEAPPTSYPDVTIHSKSNSSSECSLRERGACASLSQHSLRRRRKLSQSSLRSRSMSNASKELPEILSQHVISTDTGHSTTPSPPDVLADSPTISSSNDPDVMSNSQCSVRSLAQRRFATLDSRPRSRSNRFNSSPGCDTNPYHTPPRASTRRYSTSSGRSSDHRHSLLYSSLTRNASTALPVERAGPPPDIAAQPPRRLTGTSTPPDVTSSPNNTWQAML